ncbi:MAG: FAD-dependent oxidoreductase, partial [Bacteroidota bacterium]
KIPGDATSGLIHTVQNEYFDLQESGKGDQRIQASCFRACLTKDSLNRVPFKKPENYNRDWYEIYLRYMAAGGQLYSPYYSIPNQKTDLGAWHDLSHNLYGFNHDYPAGDYETRQKIYQYHLDFTKGLFWFLANDPAVDEDTRKAWSEWGTTKDEFTDNEGWPRQIYIRDGRRLVSDFVHTEHDTHKDTTTIIPKPVGVAYWPPDVHHVRRIIKDGAVYNEGFVFGGEHWKPFSISYESLVPKRPECTNILTPTCPSSSHIAYGAIRLEWTYMVLGQSVAAAASICLDDKLAVQDVDSGQLRKKLLSLQQVIVLDEEN